MSTWDQLRESLLVVSLIQATNLLSLELKLEILLRSLLIELYSKELDQLKDSSLKESIVLIYFQTEIYW